MEDEYPLDQYNKVQFKLKEKDLGDMPKDKVEVESTVLGELVDKLNAEFPGFKDRLVDEEGELRYFVNIYLNGEDVRFMDGLGTATSDGDEISIVPAVAGGF